MDRAKITISEADAAKEIGVHVRTLRNWRRAGEGPDFLKIGRIIRYRPVDLETWAETKIQTSAA